MPQAVVREGAGRQARNSKMESVSPRLRTIIPAGTMDVTVQVRAAPATAQLNPPRDPRQDSQPPHPSRNPRFGRCIGRGTRRMQDTCQRTWRACAPCRRSRRAPPPSSSRPGAALIFEGARLWEVLGVVFGELYTPSGDSLSGEPGTFQKYKARIWLRV